MDDHRSGVQERVANRPFQTEVMSMYLRKNVIHVLKSNKVKEQQISLDLPSQASHHCSAKQFLQRAPPDIPETRIAAAGIPLEEGFWSLGSRGVPERGPDVSYSPNLQNSS